MKIDIPEPKPVFPEGFDDWSIDDQADWVMGFMRQAWASKRCSFQGPMKIAIGKAAELSALLSGNVEVVTANPEIHQDEIEAFWEFVQKRMESTNGNNKHHHRSQSSQPSRRIR